LHEFLSNTHLSLFNFLTKNPNDDRLESWSEIISDETLILTENVALGQYRGE